MRRRFFCKFSIDHGDDWVLAEAQVLARVPGTGKQPSRERHGTGDAVMSGKGLSPEELGAEIGIALPAKEVVSIIDVNADINVGIDAASPIDLSAAANLNVAAPIQAAAGANVLTYGSDASSTATHSTDGGVIINQGMADVDATATSLQDSGIDQSGDTSTGGTDTGGTDTGGTDTGTTVDTSAVGLTEGALLNVDVNVDLNADLAAPIAGAVAANANVAAPINAGVAANIGSIDSTANAVTIQDAVINQSMSDVHATAYSDQTSSIDQGSGDTTGDTAGASTASASTGDSSGGTASGDTSGGTSGSGTGSSGTGTSSGGTGSTSTN
ncbi:peptidoglycan-binding protein [Mycobacterium sp. ACS1612]|uniref:peptidoglycan-binding protein n=1 Tax=Mycobacterium sp. ACS1612 TaxID=1834117 RepID=UPI001E3C4D9A|nr:peptidoglycan-binding protein [Mycobacterium sp. ACS1612]